MYLGAKRCYINTLHFLSFPLSILVRLQHVRFSTIMRCINPLTCLLTTVYRVLTEYTLCTVYHSDYVSPWTLNRHNGCCCCCCCCYRSFTRDAMINTLTCTSAPDLLTCFVCAAVECRRDAAVELLAGFYRPIHAPFEGS